jgi:hypothetical protein
MREDARALCGWDELKVETAADMACVTDRTWRRFEKSNPHERKTMPASVVKAFCFEAALISLENAEGDGKLEEVLGGPLTVKSVFDYVEKYFEKWDPAGE